MHIGLIGGIGPAATVVYYQRLVAATRAMGVPLNLTIAHTPDIMTLIRNNLADRRTEQAREYAVLIDRLRDAGCNCAAITSLGGHFCFAETKAISSLPLVSAVAPLDDAFAARGIASVGLLGTRVVMRTRMYGALRRTRALAPDDRIDEVGQTYQDIATSGACTEPQRAVFFGAGREMIARGAQAIVLGGTDLGLAFDGHDPGFPVIDALDVHVEMLADLATGRRTLADLTGTG
ncbi:MAG: aspartate/glutamate racemase family protein [Paracoccaceae bacterium]